MGGGPQVVGLRVGRQGRGGAGRLRAVPGIDRIDGRKIFLSGRLLDGDVVLCEAEALFLTLLPGQP